MDKGFICSVCGYIGAENKVNKGSGLLEIILWFFFLIPGLIYSVWRRSGKPNVCPSCGNKSLIPLSTPMGQELLSKQGKTKEEASALVNKAIGVKVKDRKNLALIGVIIFVVIIVMGIINH